MRDPRRSCKKCIEKGESSTAPVVQALLDDYDRRVERPTTAAIAPYDVSSDAADGICPCKLTALLAKIGAPHAARMHANMAGKWSVDDLVAHMDEEDRFLFPLLRKVARHLKSVGATRDADRIERNVDRLASEHVAYRRDYTDKGLMVPGLMLGPHGHAEDAIVANYLDLISLEATSSHDRPNAEASSVGAWTRTMMIRRG